MKRYLIITKIFQKSDYGEMTENENYEIADLISKISPYIRFVGVISKTGQLLAYFRRDNLKPLLDQKNTLYQWIAWKIVFWHDSCLPKGNGIKNEKGRQIFC